MHRLPLLAHLCPFQRDWLTADGALDWSVCYGHDRGWDALFRSLPVAEGIRVLLGEEGHPDSDFFLIFLHDRLQEGEEVLNPPRILLVEDVCAELAHEIGVVHLSGPPQTRQSHTRLDGGKYRKLCMVSNQRF